MKQKIETPEKLLEIVNGYRISRIILSAHELDVFNSLGSLSLTSGELARITGTDPRATDRLLNALVSLGILNKEHALFSNSDLSLKYLVRNSNMYLGNLSHQVHLWKTWSTLTETVRAGRSVATRKPIGERGENWIEDFISAMHSRRKQASEVATLLDLSKVKKMLDVGGGSGVFSFEFIQRNPDIRSVVFDLPEVIPLTQKYIEKEKLAGKVTTCVGDYLLNDFPGSYDLVLLSAIVHINSDQENRTLIRKCSGVLNPGGRVVIMDHIMNEDRTEPGIGAFFAINMLVGTGQGDTYTESEMKEWMLEAGLININLHTTPGETCLMVGTKK